MGGGGCGTATEPDPLRKQKRYADTHYGVTWNEYRSKQGKACMGGGAGHKRGGAAHCCSSSRCSIAQAPHNRLASPAAAAPRLLATICYGATHQTSSWCRESDGTTEALGT
jgi:hypothetical protein